MYLNSIKLALIGMRWLRPVFQSLKKLDLAKSFGFETINYDNYAGEIYYGEGEEVFSNVPLGYSDGESEVQVTMYSSGALLNCFQLTEENCLAWVESAE